VIVAITFVCVFFIKENKNLIYQDDVYKKQIKTNNEWFYFLWICLLGSLIAFIR
jgi:hypothetical protein